MGLKQLVVAINKMDMIDYDELQYVRVKKRVQEYLVNIGYSKDNIYFCPVSGLNGENLYNEIS